jgi:aerobic-type carbon monoxide dehydrogenase small subunit (CoxS/CutS family)
MASTISHCEAVFETKVGYLKFKFNVTVEVTRAEKPSSLAICRCRAYPEALDAVRLASRKRKVRPSI